MPVYDVKLPIRAQITIRVEADDKEWAIEKASDHKELHSLYNLIGHHFDFIEEDYDKPAEATQISREFGAI